MTGWLLVVLGVLAMLPAWAAGEAEKQTLTVTMRLAEAEWQVMRQEVLPTFEILCRCRGTCHRRAAPKPWFNGCAP